MRSQRASFMLIAAIVTAVSCYGPWSSPAYVPQEEHVRADVRASVPPAVISSSASVIVAGLYVQRERRWQWTVPSLAALFAVTFFAAFYSFNAISTYQERHLDARLGFGWGVMLVMLGSGAGLIMVLTDWWQRRKRASEHVSLPHGRHVR
jgi:hypothetical protein